MRGVPWIAVAEVILNQPQVVPFIREREAAGMPKHVRVHRAKIGPRARRLDDIAYRLPRERLPALGNEQPGKRVACDGLLDAETVLETADPHPRLCEIDILPPEADGLGYPQPVPEHHQKHEVIANTVTALLGSSLIRKL